MACLSGKAEAKRPVEKPFMRANSSFGESRK